MARTAHKPKDTEKPPTRTTREHPAPDAPATDSGGTPVGSTGTDPAGTDADPIRAVVAGELDPDDADDAEALDRLEAEEAEDDARKLQDVGRLIYRLERQAKGHGLDADRTLMKATAAFLRDAAHLEEIVFGPDGREMLSPPPDRPTGDPEGLSVPASELEKRVVKDQDQSRPALDPDHPHRPQRLDPTLPPGHPARDLTDPRKSDRKSDR